jgi:hypothetical protein
MKWPMLGFQEERRMNSIVAVLGYVEIAVCVAALSFLVIRKRWTDYWALG